MSLSFLQKALLLHEAYEVPKNDVHFITFTNNNGLRAIGTQHLNGCTAVAVVSPYAAILAYIPPAPYFTSDPNVGMENVQAKINLVLTYYNENRAFFPAETTVVVVGATTMGVMALQHHTDYIGQTLYWSQLPCRVVTYSAAATTNPAQGSVFVDARRGIPLIYVEDQLMVVNLPN